MSNGLNGSISEIFLGFLTGVAWLLLSVLGVTSTFFGLIGLGEIADILSTILAIVGFLAFLLFGASIFRRIWRNTFR
ncbi:MULTISPECIES: ABC transporter [Bacillaceae]|uniref:ABC transporter n=1 Tax=Bacillaceae TaxID=186817 RepID=UPI000E716488|nr:ABC transporter [Bacillus sp. PK3_68]RJS58674.1 ABC transporter [Bacillus sp. PK3_68]